MRREISLSISIGEIPSAVARTSSASQCAILCPMVGKICRLGGQQLPGTLAVKSATTVWFNSSIWMDRPKRDTWLKAFLAPEFGEESERVTDGDAPEDGAPRRTKRGWPGKDIA
jgi:hypothetical protein